MIFRVNGAKIFKDIQFSNKYDIGSEKAFEDIERVKGELNEFEKQLEKYNDIMKNLNYPDETAGCIKSIENSVPYETKNGINN